MQLTIVSGMMDTARHDQLKYALHKCSNLEMQEILFIRLKIMSVILVEGLECFLIGQGSPSTSIQASNWQKINKLFIFVLYTASKMRTSLKICAVCVVQKSVLFNLLCVFGLCSECWQSTLSQIVLVEVSLFVHIHPCSSFSDV